MNIKIVKNLAKLNEGQDDSRPQLIMPAYWYPNRPIPLYKKAKDSLDYSKNSNSFFRGRGDMNRFFEWDSQYKTLMDYDNTGKYLGDSNLRHNPITCPVNDYYYNKFHCIAGACQHTCCQGWEIDVDEEKLPCYRAMADIAPHIDETDTPHFRLTADERCPFLNRDKLCDMILHHGEDILCQTCRDHPRFRSFWTDRTEIGLGLVCEEAGRLILSQEQPMQLIVLSDDGDTMPMPEDEIELGIGVHGESSGNRIKLPRSRELARMVCDILLEDYPIARGEEVAISLGGLGGMTWTELDILYKDIYEYLTIDKGLKIWRHSVRNSGTQELGGFIFSIGVPDEEIKKWMAAPLPKGLYPED